MWESSAVQVDLMVEEICWVGRTVCQFQSSRWTVIKEQELGISIEDGCSSIIRVFPA